MAIMRLLVVSVLAALAATVAAVDDAGRVSGVLDKEQLVHNMNQHMEAMMLPRHPREDAKANLVSAREYVKAQFKLYALNTEIQHFNTTVKLSTEIYEEVGGCNIIGIAQGNSSRNLLVVGAHYDSSGDEDNNKPLRDNGAGMAVLLEVARAFQDSTRWKGYEADYTTVFVAFDLNTKEQTPESPGHSGSYLFVHEWLLPMLLRERRVLGNSIIIDSIATYNTEEDTQILPADFKNVFPKAYQDITGNDKKGDFLAAIAPPGDSEELVRDFSGHYNKDRMSRPFRLQEVLSADTSFGSEGSLDMVNHQASFHFWTARPAMPSMLLTDTGENRILPKGEDCSKDCNYVFQNPQRMSFLAKTYYALCDTLLEMQTTYVGLHSTAVTVLPSTPLLLLVSLFSWLLLR